MNKLLKVFGLVTVKEMVRQIEETRDDIYKEQVKDVRRELYEQKGK